VSLISEGLKKAHLETLRQDREQRRQYLGPGRVDVPQGGSHFAAILTAAVASSIVAAAVVIYFVGSKPSAAPQTVVVAAAPAPSRTAAPVAPPAERSVASVLPQPSAGTVQPVKGTITSLVPVAPSAAPAPQRSVATAPVAEPRREDVRKAAPVLADDERVEAPVTPEPPRPRVASRDRFRDGATYASPVSAPGGIEVALSGISSARGESVAIMNGNVVRAGSAVGPFIVEKIERGRVQLRYVDVRFWMTY
jgi:hypothetical protein